MKHKIYHFKLALFAFGIVALGFMAFQFAPSNPVNFEPILMSRTDMESSVDLGEARPIIAPGKIWVYNNNIFLIEQYRGIHIIDNSNPSASKAIGFIQVDGCTDITMKGNIIYANNAVDMIGIKGNTDFSSVEVVTRNRNMLPKIASPEPWGDSYYYDKLPENTVIVRWIPYQN
jgi:hypothetical protein